MSSSAHTYNELEDMLKSFRCQDLANLLSYAGQSKNGKKSELYDRCINILKKGNPTIQIKIKEIYNAKLSTSSVNNYSSLMSAINSNSNSGSSSPDPNLINRYQMGSNSTAMPPIYSTSFNQFPNNHSISSNGVSYPHNVVNTRSNVFGIGSNNNNNFSNSQNFKVQFEKLAFFQYLHELYSATKMTIMNPNQRQYSFWFNFFMTIDQANEITGTRESHLGKFDYSKQIHLRFGFFDSSIQADNLPPNLVVNVNGRPAQLPAPKPTSKPNADIVRPGRSIDVTTLCRLAPNIPNKVEIQWTNPDPSKQYCVGVYVFKKVSVSSLIENLKKNCLRDAEETRKMVRDKLQITDSDFEIETDTLKVSLHCPLMKTRLQLPGRSHKCKHVQCFELESYLMMNEKKPTWNCPVCDQHAPYDDLIIDALNQEILAKCTDAEEVVFAADGSWTKFYEQEKSGPTTSTKKKHDDSANKSIQMDEEPCVELCDSPPPVKRNNSITENISIPSINTTSTTSNSNTNSNKKDDDIIDLTCDSDEEMPLQPTKTNKTNGTNITNINNNVRSVSRSSSNSSSIYNNQNSTEAQASSSSSDSNIDDLNRNKNNNNNININNINNKIKDKEIRPNANPPTQNGSNNTLSPSNQSIISISSNSSVHDDHSRSQTPTNLDQLNTNATNIITNISKLFQNDALSLSRPGTASSSSSTLTSTSTSNQVPMETSSTNQPNELTTRSTLTPTNPTTLNPVLSNSQLARGLSAPSPTRHDSINISPSLMNTNQIRPNSSSTSLNSIPGILENINKNSNISPSMASGTSSNANTSNNSNRIFSPNSTKLSSAQHSPVQAKKLPSMDNTQQPRQQIDERLIKPPHLIPSQTQQQLLQQQQQQRINNNNNNNPKTSSNLPQRPNEHSLLNQNKFSSVNKPHKKPEYITKEKALMVNEELKSMQSNPNTNILEQNYKNRPTNSVVVNPQIINKARPQQSSPNIQPHTSQMINNSNQKIPINRNSFDSDPSKNTQLNKPTNQVANQMNNVIKPSTLNNNMSSSHNKIPIPPPHLQQQRPAFDPNRPSNAEPPRKPINSDHLQQQQRNFQQNSNHNLNPPKLKPQNAPNMNMSHQQQHQQQGVPKPPISSNNQQPMYRNPNNPASNNISPTTSATKQGLTSNAARPNIPNNPNNLHPQMNYQKNMSHSSINTQQQPIQPVRPTPYPLGAPIQNNFYSNQIQQPQQHHHHQQQQHHIQQLQQQQIRHQQQQQHAHHH